MLRSGIGKASRVLFVVGVLGVSSCVWAESFDEGLEAFRKGDEVTAFKIFKALADQGDVDAQYKPLIHALNMFARSRNDLSLRNCRFHRRTVCRMAFPALLLIAGVKLMKNFPYRFLDLRGRKV